MNTAIDPLWGPLIGQDEAVELLLHSLENPVHAYLFVGPAGSGKRRAARSFAAALLCNNGRCGTCRDCVLALSGRHPDVLEIDRVGAAISADQAAEIVRSASRSPIESSRKVLILNEFHLLDSRAAASLLKTVEEPPASTVFCILADQVPDELITIASRCVRVPFHAVPDALIARVLEAEGLSADQAAEVARAAAGDLDRARLLATDPALAQRREVFASIPHRVDGTGRRVIQLIDEIQGLIESAAEPLKERQAAECEALEELVKSFGERGSGRRSLEDRHKRELRRHRTDELKSGLNTMIGEYRNRLVQGVDGRRAEEDLEAVNRIIRAIENLDRNSNEALLLQALLLSLPPI